MTPNVQTFRAYARIPAGVVDEICQLCLDAAIEDLRDQGVPPMEHSKLYELAVLMLALHFYDNRGLLADKTAELPMGVQAIVIKLHYKPDDVEVGADGV